MYKTFVAIFSTAILIAACNSPKEETHKHISKEKEERIEKQHSDNQLVLNDGARWIANPETTSGVNNMIELISNFKEVDNLDAYKALTEKLNNEFTTIFKKCTMKGEAHNQLHHFLIPINEEFHMLSSENIEECKKSYERLNNHLAIYKDYFE